MLGILKIISDKYNRKKLERNTSQHFWVPVRENLIKSRSEKGKCIDYPISISVYRISNKIKSK
jgi:hypothetical protein